MLLEHDAAFMTMKEFDDLSEYSCSIPTGAKLGKMWKRGEPYMEPRKRWLLGQFVQHPDPDLLSVKWREIFIVQ